MSAGRTNRDGPTRLFFVMASVSSKYAGRGKQDSTNSSGVKHTTDTAWGSPTHFV